MQHTLLIAFLRTLKQTDRPAFVIAVAFIGIQLAFTFIKLEAAPFFLYGMYSENTPATDTFSNLTILVNDKPLQGYAIPVRERYLLEETAGNFIRMKENNYTDPVKTRIESRYPSIFNASWYHLFSGKIYNSPEAIRKYPAWFRQKCLGATGMQKGNVKIIRTTSVLDTSSLQFKPVNHEILEDL